MGGRGSLGRADEIRSYEFHPSPAVGLPFLGRAWRVPPASDVIPYAAVLIASLGCFRFWEFWSLGGLEDFYNLLRNSETPNLPVAKAIRVILVYIPAIARWLKSSSRITSSQVRD